MKNKLFTLFAPLLFLTFSCDANKNSDQEENQSSVAMGDSLLRNEHIVEQINQSCAIEGDFFGRSESEINSYNKRCVWNKLTYDYTEINTSEKVRELIKNEQSRVYIQNLPAPKSTALPGFHSYLFIEKNGIKKDSILIYKEDQYEEALLVLTKLFFIEKNVLITMEVEDNESGSWVTNYSKYKIDFEKGSFVETLSKRPKRTDHGISSAHEQSSENIARKYHGTFFASVETEATSSGMGVIDYTFSIEQGGIRLKTNTYHEPIRCNGTYSAVEKDQILELYFTGAEATCDTENPMFFLKEENGEIYAKGLGSEGTYQEWIKLKKK